MQIVDVGEPWPVETAWWDSAGEDAEPSAITLTIVSPSGVSIVVEKGDMTTPDVAPAVESHWTYSLDVTEEGLWRGTAVATVDGNEVSTSFVFLAGDASAVDGPCSPWITWDDVEGLCGNADLSSVSNAQREFILDDATWVLYALTGRRYPGICETTRRVCRTCVTCGGLCACGVRSTIDLSGGRYPVLAVWDVVVDGVEIAASGYNLRGRRYLDRLDDEAWPTWSDLTDPDAFHLSFAYGRRPPVGLVHAAARFAAEIAKKCAGLKCELPARVTSISREGVSYTILDSQKFIDEGRTGIYEVDLAIIADRRAKTEPRPGGYSPMHAGSR